MPISPRKTSMPHLEPEERIKNFEEVALGYTYEMALEEANRCLNCKNKPCVSGCPVNIHIPDFIMKLREGKPEEAYNVIAKSSQLPAVCGRVCPQESQCEKKCTLGIKFEPVAIGRLERFVADYHNENAGDPPMPTEKKDKKVAVVGSGPAGITCAAELAKEGYDVTIYEALHVAGGVLVYGIPEFRLPKSIVEKEIGALEKMGVKIVKNVVIGKTLTIDELFEMGFDAVFIGSGAGLPKFMGIKGEGLKGVYSANEFLTRVNLMKAYREDSNTPVTRGGKVAVVGGGNVAMDAARCARRLGSEVTIVYRRTEAELPARVEEIAHAKEEGIIFSFLSDPVELIGNEKGFVKEMRLRKMKLGEPDERGRARPVPVEGSEFTLECNAVIMALGTSPNPLIKNTTEGLETEKWGGITVKGSDGKTSRLGVWAGGDAVTGAATVISAMGAGKAAAKAICEYLSK